jgi:hypothetical protein
MRWERPASSQAELTRCMKRMRELLPPPARLPRNRPKLPPSSQSLDGHDDLLDPVRLEHVENHKPGAAMA